MINWKKPAAGADLYVDLGTANTLVVDRKQGLLINEPSVIAFEELHDGRRKVVAVGQEAKLKMGRTPGNLVACHPLREGVIADLDSTQTMLQHFLSRPGLRSWFSRPKVVISLPHGVSEIEKKAVQKAALMAGAKEVVLIGEPIAAAVGAGLPVHAPQASMVLDIGGGTTEVAVISLYGVGHCESVRLGGHSFDEAIVAYLRKQHNLIVGTPSAERLKMEIGCALTEHEERFTEIRGVDFVSGLPRSLRISSRQVLQALEDSLQLIIQAVHRTLENTEPELMADLIATGMVVTGGGALIRGLAERLEADIKIPVRITEKPLETLARGGQKLLQDGELLSRVMIERASLVG